jgi:hypothetical protein
LELVREHPLAGGEVAGRGEVMLALRATRRKPISHGDPLARRAAR